MISIRIWTLESDNDAKAVGCLANKLVEFMELIHTPEAFNCRLNAYFDITYFVRYTFNRCLHTKKLSN